MTNHVHVIGEPRCADSIAKTFKYCHGAYATEFNKKYSKSGHLWQGRPFSCVLDESHAWAALRYVERNPVRAGMVGRAEDYRWSSASSHCGLTSDPLLSSNWPPEGIPRDWRSQLAGEANTEEEDRIREKTYTGRPCGSEDFMRTTESATRRVLAPSKRGRKSNGVEERSLVLPWTDDEIGL